MSQSSIGFIGAGNMTTALISGLIEDGYSPGNLWVTDVSDKKLHELEQGCGVHATSDKKSLLAHVDVLVLAVKPQQLKSVCEELAPHLDKKRVMLISVAAGIQEASISQWLSGDVAIVRAMPNTPALIRSGASGLYANAQTTEEQRSKAENILRAVGVVMWIDDESQMDVVTALSGSGPAYFFRIMEALEKAACEKGMPAETAHILVLQTALGAAKLAMESDNTLMELRKKVTSPGGTTEKGIAAMESEGIEALCASVIAAASQRAHELSEEFGETA